MTLCFNYQKDVSKNNEVICFYGMRIAFKVTTVIENLKIVILYHNFDSK